MAAVKAVAGSGSTKVSSGQSNIMVRMKLLVTWTDHRNFQGINMTFDDIKNKAMECFNYVKEKENGPMPDFVTSTGYGFHSFKHSREAKSTDEETAASYPDHLKAIIEEWGTSLSRCSTWI